MDRWIASRVLVDDAGHAAVEVALGEPKLVPGEPWECAIRLVVDGVERKYRALGEDAFQALMVGIEGIRVELAKLGRSLTWHEGRSDPGFPRTVPAAFGPAFAKKVDALIDAEVTRFTEEAKAARAK